MVRIVSFVVKVQANRKCEGTFSDAACQPAVSCNVGRANLLFIASN